MSSVPPHQNFLAHPVVAVVGPTASGKSAVALQLAKALGGEIVSTDSMQVYRGMDLGTAKPTAEEQALVPHHLIDVVNPDTPFSAGRYVEQAQQVLARLQEEGKVAVLCGGTGLYFRALLYGLAQIPDIPPDVRAEVQALVEDQGLAAAYARLQALDPQMAHRLEPADTSRIMRALEVFLATGESLAEFQAQQPFYRHNPMVLQVGVQWPREVLYERINHRTRQMLEQGWAAEVQALLQAGYGGTKPMQSIGYLELAAHLVAGGSTAPDAWPQALAPAIAQRTRHYAKRQLTWFRKDETIRWVAPTTPNHPDMAEQMTEQIQEDVRFFLKNTPAIR